MSTDQAQVINAFEVAGLLRLNVKTVYEYARRGVIPCRRVGKQFLFSRTRVLEWVAGEDKRPR